MMSLISKCLRVLSLLLLLSSCTSYRINYVAEISLPDSKLTSDPAKPDSPSTNSETKLKYYYGESFSNFAIAILCPVTFYFYGGFCWSYAGLPYSADAFEISSNAKSKLKEVLGNTPFRIDSIELRRVNYKKQEPAHFFANADGETVSDAAVVEKFKKSESEISEFQRTQTPANKLLGEPDFYRMYKGFGLSLFSGRAEALSSVDINGQSYTVASGKADYRAWLLSWRSTPLSGLYWSWSPQYLQQRITVRDFAASLPSVEVANAQNIPVVVTDPQSGQKIALDQYTNGYKITLESYGLFGGMGYAWQSRSALGQSRFAFDGGIWGSLAEYLRNSVEHDGSSKNRNYFAFGASYRVELNLTYYYPRLSSAIGIHYLYLNYPKVHMPGEMEFRGPGLYNADKQVFERSRLFLNDVSFSTRAFGISYTYLFDEGI